MGKITERCSKTVTGLIFAVVYCCNYISLDESKESSASGLQIESDVDVLKRQTIFEEISPL